jgi:hypothetical protein
VVGFNELSNNTVQLIKAHLVLIFLPTAYGDVARALASAVESPGQ